jgi:hypothetical protein
MVAGLFLTSIMSGVVISRTGRYKIFPLSGCAVMGVGLYLMSTMGPATSTWLESLYMFVLGMGIGLAMQALIIAVQNTVHYADLGTATSGVTFFRTLGSCFGAAIFGTLFTNQLIPNLQDAFAQVPGVPPAAAQSPHALHALPEALATPIINAYADSIAYVFRWVVPVAVLGFLVAWFLKEVPLRDAAREHATDIGEGFSVPTPAERVDQLERAIGATVRKESLDRAAVERLLVTAGGGLNPGQAWAMGQIHLHTVARGQAELPAIAGRLHIPREVLAPAFNDLSRAGLARIDGDAIALTPAGQVQLDRVQTAWRHWLDDHLDDWTLADAEDRALLDQALTNIATRLVDEQPERQPALV